jgi:hypothetical protein
MDQVTFRLALARAAEIVARDGEPSEWIGSVDEFMFPEDCALFNGKGVERALQLGAREQ